MRDNYDGDDGLPPSKSPSCVEDILSELMTALATGARAVQGLPIGDDFDYQSSFPEFRQLLDDSQESLLESLLMTLNDTSSILGLDTNNYRDNDNHHDFDNLDDPLLLEICTDLCDSLLEQAELSMSSNFTGSTALGGNLNKELLAVRNRAQSSFGRLLNSIVDMEKPQLVYSFGPKSNPLNNNDEKDKIIGFGHGDVAIAQRDIGINERLCPGNRRADVFLPPFLRKKYFEKEQLLNFDDKSWRLPGHGIETKLGEMKPIRVSPNVIAPSNHYRHPYQVELQSIRYPTWQLEAPATKPPIINKFDGPLSTNAVWIDTPEGLNNLQKILENNHDSQVQEIAIDLEAHSYRSFAGFICLIQISIENGKDFVIDPFPLWDRIHNALASTLANPNIVKVLHGADSDIAWLQRDFGLYIVNLFDTGRAARALKLPSYGFAYLLEKYVNGVQADKTHQLSDWRQRPLSAAMKEYAIMDTHYLLGIYRAMKYDLSQSKIASIDEVLDESRKVCTIRFTPEPFRPDGYRSLTHRSGHKTQLNARQDVVLRELWDWRDQIARQLDESYAYVCTNAQLMRLAMACPVNFSTLQGLLQPMPPLLIRNSKEVLTLIQRCLHSCQLTKPQREQHQPSSAFFKPAEPDNEMEESGRRSSSRSLMSPVLGTEALYREAGWISPVQDRDNELTSREEKGDLTIEDILTTSATENDSDDGDESKGITRRKPRRGLVVHEANRKFQGRQFALHSLKMNDSSIENISLIGKGTGKKEDVISGFGPARITHHSRENMEEAIELAKNSAAQIRTSQESCGIIELISSGIELQDEDDDNSDLIGDEEDEDKERMTDQEEFVIPRSMREIYRISNRNRRNKKSSSPLPPEQNEEELQELSKAEAILKSRSSEGKKYIDMIPNSPKRQRTKSSGAGSLSSSDEAIGQDSGSVTREDDISLMQDIGWIEGKDEVDKMLKQRLDAPDDDDDSNEPFDYSNVGSIGAFSPTPTSNPFFTGAALTGGHLNQQMSKSEKKKTTSVARSGKQSRRQIERPEKRGVKSQAFKKG